MKSPVGLGREGLADHFWSERSSQDIPGGGKYRPCVATISLGFFKPLGALQTPGKKGAQSLLNTARGKKRPAPAHSSDEEEEEEDSEEDGVVNQGDLWGSEDSDADMIDDYGIDSNSEDEDEEVSLFLWLFRKRSLHFSLSRPLRRG